MTVRERQQVKVLLVLALVLGLTVIVGYRRNGTTAAVAEQPQEKQQKALLPTSQSARIDLDLAEQARQGEDAGKNNLFQYRTGPGSPPPLHPVAPAPPPVFPVTAPAPPRPSGPPPPPPPPPIPFKYEGFVSGSGGKLTAFVTDTANAANHYNVTEGEVLMGRYRITRVTESTIEIEDIDFNRRQSFSRVQQ